MNAIMHSRDNEEISKKSHGVRLEAMAPTSSWSTTRLFRT